MTGGNGTVGPRPPDPSSEPSTATVLRRARLAKGWSQQRLIYEIRRVATERGLPTPTDQSLKTMISLWERGHRIPDELNRRLLCSALGISLASLPLPIDSDIPW